MWFGEFLCQSGQLSLDQLTNVLDRYFSQREPIGQLALRRRFLESKQIDEILEVQKTSAKRFGEIAIELGSLSDSHVTVLIGMQWRESDLWEFIVSQGLVSSEAMEQRIMEFRSQER